MRYGRGTGTFFAMEMVYAVTRWQWASVFRVFKFKSASERFEGVIVRLSEKLEGFSQFSGFLFQFIHDGVPLKHHYMVDLDPLGRVTDKWLLAFVNQMIMVILYLHRRLEARKATSKATALSDHEPLLRKREFRLSLTPTFDENRIMARFAV